MIVIDAGHGGEDSGAVGNGIIEKDLTLKISKYMEERFKELGEEVAMTRTTDETVSPSERVQRVLSAFGRSPNAIVISNHINAGGGDGAEVIYALRNTSTLSNLILEEIAKRGQNVRRAYQRRLPSDTSKDYYFILRETSPLQSVLVEYGFLDSPKDDVFQLKNFYKDYAEAVVQAVMTYKGKPYRPPSLENFYIVQKGDSLWSISKKFNISVEQLKEFNNLTTNLISLGQVLNLPVEKIPEIPIEREEYIVVAGDSLYRIAERFNTTVEEIMRLNSLTTTNLSIGQRLILLQSDNIFTYTVKRGDNLYSIARSFNTTVDSIKRKNNLKSDLLSIGQKLII